MEIQNVPDYEERPVIDIDVEFVGGTAMHWTINNRSVDILPGGGLHPVELNDLTIRFEIPETNQVVLVQRQNVAWFSLCERIDKIPVRNSPDMDLHNVKK